MEYEVSSFSTSSPTLVIINLFAYSHCSTCELVSHCNFKNSLYVLDKSYTICKYFFPFCALDTIVIRAKVSNFDVQFISILPLSF